MCCFPDWHFQKSKSDCWFVQLIFFFLTEGEDVCTLLIECISLVKRQRKLKKWCDDRILSHDAPRFMLYYHCVRDTSLSVIFSTREEKIDRSARCGWFPNMFRFSSFCFWDYRVGLYSLSFEGEFQRYFDQEGFYMYFTDLSRTPLCTRSHCKHKV